MENQGVEVKEWSKTFLYETQRLHDSMYIFGIMFVICFVILIGLQIWVIKSINKGK